MRLKEENLELSTHVAQLSEEVVRSIKNEDKLIEELDLSKRNEEGLKRELDEALDSTKKLYHMLVLERAILTREFLDLKMVRRPPLPTRLCLSRV